MTEPDEFDARDDDMITPADADPETLRLVAARHRQRVGRMVARARQGIGGFSRGEVHVVTDAAGVPDSVRRAEIGAAFYDDPEDYAGSN